MTVGSWFYLIIALVVGSWIYMILDKMVKQARLDGKLPQWLPKSWDKGESEEFRRSLVLYIGIFAFLLLLGRLGDVSDRTNWDIFINRVSFLMFLFVSFWAIIFETKAQKHPLAWRATSIVMVLISWSWFFSPSWKALSH